MLRHIALFLALVLGVSSTVQAQEPDTAVPSEVDAAPLLLLFGPYGKTRPLAAALTDVARRDGGAFLDLSPSPPAPPAAGSELRHAVAAYQEFDYGRAMKHLASALEEIASGGVRGLSNSELCDLFIYRALVRNAQGDSSAAWDDFIQAALIDPTRHLDAVRFSPSVAASFERARKEVSESSPVALRVHAAANCALVVDGQLRGLEAAVSLRRGTHFTSLDCPGYQRYSDVLRLDGDMDLRPTLEPIAAPSHKALIALAKPRGFRHLVFVEVSMVAPVRTALFLLLRNDGTELGRTSMNLEGTSADRPTAVVAATRLLDMLAPVVPESIPVVTDTPWYKNRWLWAAAGVVATSAILLPFALQDQQSAGFRIELGGDTP